MYLSGACSYDVLEPCYLGPNDDDNEEEKEETYIDDTDMNGGSTKASVAASAPRLNSMQQVRRAWSITGDMRLGQDAVRCAIGSWPFGLCSCCCLHPRSFGRLENSASEAIIPLLHLLV